MSRVVILSKCHKCVGPNKLALFPPYLISKFSTLLVYLGQLIYEICSKYPPYSLILPYLFIWHLCLVGFSIHQTLPLCRYSKIFLDQLRCPSAIRRTSKNCDFDLKNGQVWAQITLGNHRVRSFDDMQWQKKNET